MTKKTTKVTQAAIDKSLTELDTILADALESAKSMRERVQQALVGCVSHWALTGSNAGLMDRLNMFLKELGQGVNLKAVKSWMEEHLYMIEDAEGKRMVFKAVKLDEIDTAKASADNWWSHKQQTVFTYDLTEQIIALATKAAKASEKEANDNEGKISVDPELLVALNALAKKAEAKKQQNEPAH